MKPFAVDISHHNVVAPNGFVLAKNAGLVGVIHKATQGLGYADPMYAKRRKAATDAGLLWGAYHFNTGDPVSVQVQHFLDVAQPDARTMMVLDYEDNRVSNMSVAQARDFLMRLDDALGRRCVIYGGNRIKEQLPKSDPFFGAHRLWLCQYGAHAVLPKSWSKFFLWQFTGDGIGPLPHTVPGFNSNGLDINTYGGTAAELAAEWA